jgi:hypothetical protein
MNLSSLTREQLEEIVRMQDYALSYLAINLWTRIEAAAYADETRAKVQRMIEEDEGAGKSGIKWKNL